MLTEDRDKFSGDLLVSKYDSLKLIKRLQENWTDIGLGIFGRHKSMEGNIPPEQKLMEEILKNIARLYKEFEIRINGDTHTFQTSASPLPLLPRTLHSPLPLPSPNLKSRTLASHYATIVFCPFWPRPPSSLKPGPPAYLLAPPPLQPHTQLALEGDKRSELGQGPAALRIWLYP